MAFKYPVGTVLVARKDDPLDEFNIGDTKTITGYEGQCYKVGGVLWNKQFLESDSFFQVQKMNWKDFMGL